MIRTLLEANIRMSEQLVVLAQKAMDTYQPAPPSYSPAAAPFSLSTTDDWDDIGGFTKARDLTVREEEEDARFSAAIGGITEEDLARALKTADFLNTEIETVDD